MGGLLRSFERIFPMHRIDQFNLAAGAILGVLFDHIPIPHDIDHSRLSAQISPEDFSDPERFDFIQIVRHAGHWLEDEGYIRRSRHHPSSLSSPTLHGMVLTQKALVVLGRMPKSITSSTSYGDLLRQGVAEGSRSVIADTFKGLITAAAAAFTAS